MSAAPAPLDPAGPPSPDRLDDVMLAMDVVDTLRHRERIVAAELDAAGREAELMRRLRDIYDAQGIEVPDSILKEGIKALEEDRFVYRPPADGVAVRLAKLYVSRRRWLAPALWSAGGLAAAALAFQLLWAGPRAAEWARLPAEVEARRAAVVALAVDPAVDADADAIARAAQGAAGRGDREEAREGLAALVDLEAQLAAEYEVRIVSRPGESTGVFRVPDDAPNARNHYIIVEAVAPGGRLVEVPVTSEEDQTTRRVSKWGQRVSEALYGRIADDKRDDQIVQNDVLGLKARGELAPEFDPGVEDGAILSW